jgi:uncharacterized phage protein gp47/JayE
MDNPTLTEALNLITSNVPSTFPIKNPDPFSVWGTFLNLAAQGVVDAEAFGIELRKQAFITTATGGYLDAHARGLNLTRIEAQRAEHLVKVTANAGGNLPANTTIFATLPDATGTVLRFRVKTSTTVTAGVNDVIVYAEGTGSAYNVTANRISQVVTVQAFITSITNNADSLQVAGVDLETDDQFRERCLLAFAGISQGGIWRNYVLWSREVPGITKVSVDDNNPRGAGTTNVYIAQATGNPTVAQLAAANAIVQARRPINSDVQVLAPTAVAVNITATIYVKAGTLYAANVSYWQTFIGSVFSQFSIGATFYPSKVVEALEAHPDVTAVVLSTLNPTTVTAAQIAQAGTVAVTLV